MNTIWDIVLNAKKNGIEKKDLFFSQADTCSPYYEQAFSLFNQQDVGDTQIEMNSRVRFNALFKELLHDDFHEYPLIKKYLFDVLVHYLVMIDLCHGLNKREFYIRKLLKEIHGGVYGERAFAYLNTMDRNQQNRIGTLVLTQLQTGASLLIFRKALKVPFDNVMIYQVKEDKQQILVYVGEKQTREREQTLSFITEMFLPICYSVRVFWEYHFGVMDIDVSMVLDEIEIY